MIVLSLVLVIVAAVTLVLGVFQDGLTLIYVSIGTCLAAMVLLGIGVLMRRREDGEPASAPSGYGPGAEKSATRDTTQAAPAPRVEEDVEIREADETTQVRPTKKAVVKKVSATPSVQARDATAEQSTADVDAGRPQSAPTASTGAAAGTAAAGAAAAAAAAGDGDDEERAAEPDPEVAVTTPRKVAAKKATVKKAAVKKATVKKTAASQPAAPAAPEPEAAEAAAADAPAAASTAKKAAKQATKKSASKKSTAKKATKKSTAKKTAKKATAKKATAKKTAKKATKKSASAKKATAKKTTGAASATLPDLKGLGPAKKQALLEEFGSVENIRTASVSDIASVKGVGAGLAETLKKELGG